MKNKLNIYCDYQFWETFFEMESHVMRDRMKQKHWLLFYDFLESNTLFFNIAIQNVDVKTVGGKNILDLSQKRGGADINFDPDNFPKVNNLTNVDDCFLNSVFLTMKNTDECVTLSQRIGVLVINLDMVFSATHVYGDNGVGFTKENGKNWTYLENLKNKYPSISSCNSLVIADRYLLENTKELALTVNLKPIFEAILPEQLDNNIRNHSVNPV